MERAKRHIGVGSGTDGADTEVSEIPKRVPVIPLPSINKGGARQQGKCLAEGDPQPSGSRRLGRLGGLGVGAVRHAVRDYLRTRRMSAKTNAPSATSRTTTIVRRQRYMNPRLRAVPRVADESTGLWDQIPPDPPGSPQRLAPRTFA